jgi:hypothetical protein
MKSFGEGDRVRIDIPDESDPDHHLHGREAFYWLSSRLTSPAECPLFPDQFIVFRSGEGVT